MVVDGSLAEILLELANTDDSWDLTSMTWKAENALQLRIESCTASCSGIVLQNPATSAKEMKNNCCCLAQSQKGFDYNRKGGLLPSFVKSL